MKSLIVLIFSLVSLQAAKADTTLMCITAMISADGTVGGIYETGGPQVIVLEKGVISSYLVKDPKVIWAAKYNLNQPFNLVWVNPMGLPGAYVAGDKVETTWKLAEEGKLVTTALLNLDVLALKGTLETEDRENGSYTGGTEATVRCSSAGVIH